MMRILSVLIVMRIGAELGQTAAQSQTTNPQQHQFTYSIVETESALTALVGDIQSLVVSSTLLADAQPFALRSPVDKPDEAPFAGLNYNQVILMLAWDRPKPDLNPTWKPSCAASTVSAMCPPEFKAHFS